MDTFNWKTYFLSMLDIWSTFPLNIFSFLLSLSLTFGTHKMDDSLLSLCFSWLLMFYISWNISLNLSFRSTACNSVNYISFFQAMNFFLLNNHNLNFKLLFLVFWISFFPRNLHTFIFMTYFPSLSTIS